MKLRVVLSLLVVIVGVFLYGAYDVSRGTIEGQLAVEQLKDDDVAYNVARTAIVDTAILKVVGVVLCVFLFLLWIGPLCKLFKEDVVRKSVSLFLFAALCFGVVGCKPYMGEMYKDIGPSETGFVVPLEGANKTSQGKFDSVAFLEERKVAAKRINIPRRYKSTGRMWYDVEIVETVRVITVDRSPVSREWTAEHETGTSKNDDLIYVESKDSIGFGIGCTITAAIEEPNTATYLYNFPQGRPLADVIDKDIRASITKILAREFGARDLAACKTDKAAIFDIAFAESSKYWKKFGVTIRMLGHSGGLSYENKRIQDAIDKNYEAEMEIERKENLKMAQKQENERLLSIEVNNRLCAEEFNKALEAQTAKIRLEIDRMEAEARLEMAKKWSGNLPNSILPQGSNLLMGLDSSVKSE